MVKDFRSISSQKLDWQIISPNEKADWINQRDGLFDSLIPLAPDKKLNKNSQSLFIVNGPNIATGRDSWAYNYSSFGYIYDATAVQVGSTEGTGRSTASEYRIEIREK